MDNVENLLTNILNRQNEILNRVNDLEDRFNKYVSMESNALSLLEESIPKRPDGKPDIEGHREFHQEIIEESRERKKLWRELRTELLKKGAVGVALVLWTLIVYWWNHGAEK